MTTSPRYNIKCIYLCTEKKVQKVYTKMIKGEKGQKLYKQMKIRHYQQKNDYFIYGTFYTHGNHKTKSRAKTKKEETGKKSQKITKLKWQTEIQGKINNEDIEQTKQKI